MVLHEGQSFVRGRACGALEEAGRVNWQAPFSADTAAQPAPAPLSFALSSGHSVLGEVKTQAQYPQAPCRAEMH